MNVVCSTGCKFTLDSYCVFYEGESLLYTGIVTNDNLQTALQKIDQAFSNASLGYAFVNGTTLISGNQVGLGGSLIQNTSITGNYRVTFEGELESSAFITTGGTSSQFVKGDGSLDSGPYQPSGNYITDLTGDGTASGPGSATLTLATVFGSPGTYGNSTTVPTITVDGKGRITNITNSVINLPSDSLSFQGDVTGLGVTGSPVTLTLNTVNTGIFALDTPLKFSVNGKGLVTSASLLTNLDLDGIYGYTPVPTTRTITINGVTQNLANNRSWTVSGTGHTIQYNGTPLTNRSNLNFTGSGVVVTDDAGNNATVVTISGGSTAAWGSIATGTGVASQTDLITYLNSNYYPLASNPAGYLTTAVTSVGLTMPAAFTVTNSPITTTGNIAVTGAGIASQYIRGDGSLGNFPSVAGGGASVNYYLNGSVPSGVAGYEEMSKTPVIGPGTDYSTSSDGYIASFLTDANDPSQLSIPAGNFIVRLYFNASSGGGTPYFYIELYKYNGVTFTLIADSSTNPEYITGGTTVDLYTTALAVPTTSLSITDRLAVRIYVYTSGRTITLHTEDNNLAEIVTTFSTGITALNGLTEQIQYLATGTSGTDFNISSSTNTHTFNIPTASSLNRGLLSTTDWSTFNNKVTSLSAGTGISIGGTVTVPIVTNTAPDQTVVLSNGTGISVTGTYPNFTITNTSPSSGGTVTSVAVGNLTPLFTSSVSNPSSTPSVTFSQVSQLQNLVFASPDGSSGNPTFRSLVAADLPSLSSIYVPVGRTITINGSTQDLSANRTWTITTTGTTDRITVTGGSGLTPTIDIASTYAGQNTITTLGTITTGTWNSTVIGAQYGGTGLNTSASTGVAQVNSGVWSVSTALANGTTATTQAANNNSTLLATTAYVDSAISSGPFWTLASGGTLTAANTITSNTANWLNFTGTWTATANNQSHIVFGGSFTSRATNDDNLFGYQFSPTITSAATNTQYLYGVNISPTLTSGDANDEMTALLVNPTYSGTNAASRGIVAYTTTASSFNGLKLVNGTNSGSVGIGMVANNGATPATNSTFTITRGNGANGSLTMINSGSGTFGIQTAATSRLQISGSGLFSFASDNQTAAGSFFDLTAGTFNPTSGSAQWNVINITTTYNQTGTASGAIYGIRYSPTLTGVLGTHYGLAIGSGLSGFGTLTPTATLQAKGRGTTTSELFRLEDSAGTNRLLVLDNGNTTLNGDFTFSDAKNLIFNTTTGTKIGTATSQKIGFWNATPIIQPSGWGTPTGTLARTTFDESTATLTQVAQRLAALITDLKSTGLLGS